MRLALKWITFYDDNLLNNFQIIWIAFIKKLTNVYIATTLVSGVLFFLFKVGWLGKSIGHVNMTYRVNEASKKFECINRYCLYGKFLKSAIST